MRRLTAALISAAAAGVFAVGSAGTAVADPGPEALGAEASIGAIGAFGAPGAIGFADPETDFEQIDESAYYRFVSAFRCRLGGGRVVYNPFSPTRLSCRGGIYHGRWVLRIR